MTDAAVGASVAGDPDIVSTDAMFWRKARLIEPRQPKQMVTLRLDADLLEWFRRAPGYQTRINSILRTYMSAQDGADSRKQAALGSHSPLRKQGHRRSGS